MGRDHSTRKGKKDERHDSENHSRDVRRALEGLMETSSLVIKLGSIARHAEELLSPDGNAEFDVAAIKGLLGDPEVSEWMSEADKLALLPVPRKS